MNSITVLMLPVCIVTTDSLWQECLVATVRTGKFVTTTNKICHEKPYWTAETIHSHIIILFHTRFFVHVRNCYNAKKKADTKDTKKWHQT
jgi:hypothetical protein